MPPIECMLGSLADGLNEVLPQGPALASTASQAGKVLLATTGTFLAGALLAGLVIRKRVPRSDSGRRGVYRRD